MDTFYNVLVYMGILSIVQIGLLWWIYRNVNK